MIRHSVSRPLLRYYGGKWRIAPWIIEHFPKHRTYIEPFGGGGSVLLRKRRSKCEIYNDLHGEVVNLFYVARDHGEELRRRIQMTPFARAEFELSYCPSDDPIEQARRTLVRSFLGYGSDSVSRGWVTGFRHNGNQRRTTPATEWSHLSDALEATCLHLQGVVIENRDAIEVMASHDTADTLHYVDPPYLPSTRKRSGRYKYEMTEQDHITLSGFLHSLKGMVILSGYDSQLYRELYSDWTMRSTIALDGKSQRRTETIWISPSASQSIQVSFA